MSLEESTELIIRNMRSIVVYWASKNAVDYNDVSGSPNFPDSHISYVRLSHISLLL